MNQSQYWPLIESFFKEEGLVRQHIDSFNEFIKNGLQEIVNEHGKIDIEIPERPYQIRFGKIEVRNPKMTEIDGSEHKFDPGERKPFLTPMIARLRNLTYSAPVYLEMAEYQDGIQQSQFKPIHIGDIPIMLKSECCPLSEKTREELIELGEDPDDPGGYFIIDGSERVIVALEDLAPNRIIVDIDESGVKPVYQAKVFSTTVGFRARIQLTMKSNGTLHVSIPGIPTPIPFVVLMRALGIEKDKEIADAVSLEKEIQNELEPSLEQAADVSTTEDAILYIGNRVAHGQIKDYRIKQANSIIDLNFMPHIGRTEDKRTDKAYFLGEMASRVIELKLGRRKPDDKDHYANKRLRFAGSLLAELFRTAFRSLCKDIKYQLERMSIKRPAAEKIYVAVRPGTITERIQHALATGNWGRGKVGISQLLDRTNFISTLSHLRRIQSPLSRSQPNFEARDLHPTHWGRLCPYETPEGSNCGLVKNLALMATTSIAVDSEKLKEILYSLGVIETKKADMDLRSKGAKIFVDGYLIGYTADPVGITNNIRDMRRRGKISPEVNITCLPVGSDPDRKEIKINCDAGRVRRPLIIVDNGVPRVNSEHITKLSSGELTWKDFINQGLIEYLDADEEENAYIALSVDKITPEHTHLELAPYAMLGVCASIIPYAEHNQSPRNSYEAAMAKQALGVSTINYFTRMDSRAHFLHYVQKPLVTTEPMNIFRYYNRPSGQNCVVAVLSFGGYNMEDALVFNKSSVERGLGHSTFYRIYEAESRQYLGGEGDRFETPEAGVRGYRGDQYYKALEGDGIVGIGSAVKGGDVLIGRTSPPRFFEEYKETEIKGPARRDTSVSLRTSEVGTVDSVLVTETAQGNKIIKVRVHDCRSPELGDKFASRHGQKGVIGMLVSQEDMPFTEDGIVPDIIINPHAIPSRMTIGQFMESIAGKVAALKGELVDATPFSNSKEGLRETLKSLGFQHSGREVLYDGTNGRKYEADIFIGIVYYQKLYHMVADKMHVRARGQVQMLTRQPTEGRARSGGLRFGEMERDCLIAYGATTLLKDRLLEESDKTMVYVCERCGYLAYYDLRSRKYVCRVCGEEAVISPTVMSYAFKLLLQELMSLCISPRLKLGEKS